MRDILLRSMTLRAEDGSVDWRHLLSYMTGSVDQDLLLRNEYLAAENRILRRQIPGKVRLDDGERRSLADIGRRLGQKALEEIATIVKPETILGWHRRLIAKKFTPSSRGRPGRPPTSANVEELVVRFARENRTWGHDRIVGALANLDIKVSDRTVGAILKRHGIPPAPQRRRGTTWKEFIRSHQAVLAATDFFTTEVWTLGGLVTCYVLFFIHLATRRIEIAGITPHPDEAWMRQMARNATMAGGGFLTDHRYLLHDRDAKFSAGFRAILDSGGTTSVPLPAKSPNLNAIAERFVRSVKEECLDKLVLFGESSLCRVLKEYAEHYHAERNHQGVGNRLLFPRAEDRDRGGGARIDCRERLGGLLNFYRRAA